MPRYLAPQSIRQSQPRSHIQPLHRRQLILGLAATALVVTADRGRAQPGAVQGIVTFAGEGKIPKGRITVFLSDPSQADAPDDTAARVDLISDGASRQIAFSLPQTELPQNHTARRLVARLEREDGWLIARGSAKLAAGQRPEVTLNTVMY
ncbi:hypothetical protein VWZ88_06200 [Phaeobacter sp. JH20_36]|uniref:hypothetical protein n=1 Tax=Phaeobacter TaxID=302485 RepID=UPI0030C9B42B